MKKIVLLGDSIRMIGYGDQVAARFSDEFDVWQPSENCRYAKRTLRGLWDWKHGISDADIIHWNNGLWDVCDLFGDGPFTPIDRYVEDMLRLAVQLKQRAKAVIFATTTPVRNDNPHTTNKRISEYNAAIVPKLSELGIVINDLYAPLSQNVKKYVSDDKIHLSADGVALAADMVESILRREAEKLGSDKYEKNNTSSDGMGAPI